MSWNWQPIDTAPVGKLVLVAIRKGALRCPGRPDRYVVLAFKGRGPDGENWAMFGQPMWKTRNDEVITHWILPELPKEETEQENGL